MHNESGKMYTRTFVHRWCMESSTRGISVTCTREFSNTNTIIVSFFFFFLHRYSHVDGDVKVYAMPISYALDEYSYVNDCVQVPLHTEYNHIYVFIMYYIIRFYTIRKVYTVSFTRWLTTLCPAIRLCCARTKWGNLSACTQALIKDFRAIYSPDNFVKNNPTTIKYPCLM